MARYERWRLRLVHTGLEPDRRRAEGTGHRALEAGYGVVCVVVLWLIDLAVVALSLVLSAGLTVTALRSADSGGGVQAAMLAVAVALLPVAAYPITAWAGARAALARAILAPREPELDRRLVEVTRSRARLVDAFELDRRRIERDLHDGAQQRLVALTVALGLARLDLAPGSAAAATGRHRPRAGQAGAGGAAGADPRRPPPGADRPRAARGRRRRRRPLAGEGRTPTSSCPGACRPGSRSPPTSRSARPWPTWPSTAGPAGRRCGAGWWTTCWSSR